MKITFIRAMTLAVLLMFTPSVWGQGKLIVSCGSVNTGGYGPFDYRVGSNRSDIARVEQHHFNRDVERLVRGQSSSIMGDLDYVLRHVPNHHRALYSLIRYRSSPKSADDRGKYEPADCYFKRAITFVPKDGVARMLYGMLLQKADRYEEALEHYDSAKELMPNNPEVHYNLGLLMVDLRNYDKANFHAQRAYGLGYPLAGLKNKLARLNAWNPKIDSESEGQESLD